MNVFTDFEARVRSAVASVNASAELSQAELARVTVEPPRDPSHGDLATNAAMVLAKPLGRKPRELAEELAAQLRPDADVVAAEVAGPGFILSLIHI